MHFLYHQEEARVEREAGRQEGERESKRMKDESHTSESTRGGEGRRKAFTLNRESEKWPFTRRLVRDSCHEGPPRLASPSAPATLLLWTQSSA